MVRRAAACNLGDLVLLSRSQALSDLFPILAKDDHDSVRQQCLHSMVKCLGSNPSLIQIIKQFHKDKSWRARYALLEHFQDILEPLNSADDFLSETLALLADNEPEVRCIALENLGLLVEKVAPEVTQSQIVPVVEKMATGVREALRTDWSIALSGIAGPDGGTAEKPVGLTFIGLAGRDGLVAVQRHIWDGDRIHNKQASVSAALTLLLTLLERDHD